MRAFPVLVLTVFALAACGERRSAADEAVNVEPAPPSAPVAQPVAAPVTPVADLETACRDAVSRLAGQTGDAVRVQKQGSDKALVSWPAPVDGGRLTMNCNAGAGRVELSSNGRQMATGLSVPSATPAKQEAR